MLDEAERLATAADDERAASHVLVQQQFLRLLHVEEGGPRKPPGPRPCVIPVFERHGDDSACAAPGGSRRGCTGTSARAEAAAAAWERAAAHAGGPATGTCTTRS